MCIIGMCLHQKIFWILDFGWEIKNYFLRENYLKIQQDERIHR